MKNAWIKWIYISRQAMNVQANIILTVLYILLIIPLAFILQTFFKKSLKAHTWVAKKNSYWIKRRFKKQDFSWAKEQ